MASGKLSTFLCEDASEYDPDSPRGVDPYSMILEWAISMLPNHGNLPGVSAQPFANWLNNQWSDFTDDDELTVEDVLKGAIVDWCGGRTF